MREPIDVFISYPFGNVTAAARISELLEREGVHAWYAESQLRSGHWRTTVEDAIDGATSVVLIVSNLTGESNEVENEFRRAEHAGKPILPVFVEACPPPLYAASLHAAHFYKNDLDAIRLIQALVEGAAERRRSAELAYLQRIRKQYSDRGQPYAPLAFESVFEGISSPDVERLVNAAVANFDLSLAALGGSDRLIGVIFESQAGTPRTRVSLVGEPGAGKTTTLLKLLDELAEKAEQDSREPMPVFIPLRNFTSALQFSEYVRDVCARTFGDLHRYFSELLFSGRLALLIDGLNELPTDAGADHLQDIRSYLDRHPTLFVAVTCLVAEYTPERSLGLDTIEISPLTPLQVQAMISSYIADETQAESLFWSLLGDEQAKSFYSDFLRMGGSEAAFWLHTGASPIHDTYFPWWLWLRLRDDPLGLLTLARNPYLLSIIIRVYKANGQPTSNRYELFTVFFEVLCNLRHERLRTDGGYWLDIDHQAHLFALIAKLMHDRGLISVPVEDVIAILPTEDAELFLQLAEQEKVVEVGDGISFSHQLLREYFAAAHVESAWRMGSPMDEFLNPDGWWMLSGWEQPIIFLAGKHARDPVRVLNWLRDSQPELTSQCLVQAGCTTVDQHVQSLAAAWLPRLQQGDEPPAGRAAIGRALGLLGLDARPGVCVLDGEGMPVFEWAHIRDSSVSIGNADPIHVPSFRMSKYLVTNAQYAPFIADGGYTEGQGDCWTHTGWQWKLIADRRSPDDYTEVFRISNHPRIGTVWYEVVAYCRWLTKYYRAKGLLDPSEEIRLPTEAEWQAAARGLDDSRDYPWGDEFSYDRCNVRDIRSTTAVGIYPDGASPEGVYDLVGNAWSWCATRWDHDSTVQNNDPEGDSPRVYRGGSWALDFNVSRWRPEELRCDQRYWIIPLDDRPDALGFFIVRGRCLT